MAPAATPNDAILTYRAAWYVTPQVIVPEALVTIGAGRVLDVRSGPATNAVNLGDIALISGLVNAHTHLEFSLLQEPFPTTSRFTDWIRRVVNWRRGQTGTVAQAIRAGIAESLRNGTTWLGDIATTGWSRADYRSEVGLRDETEFPGVIFQELLGLSDERVTAQILLANEHLLKQPRIEETLTRQRSQPQSDLATGLSPHAPYSVHPDLLRESICLASKCDCPVAMHIAETRAELELLADGTGEFRELLTEFGIWREGLFGGGRRPLDWLISLAEAPAVLVVHGNYLDDEELRFLAAHPHMTLVYCPRTHAAFGHRDHPWRKLLAWGGSVALGTDSRASNPDLSLFAELQFLTKENPDESALSLLALATRTDFRSRPSVAANSFPIANLTAIRLNDPAFRTPASDLFLPGNVPAGTMISGRWIVGGNR